MVVVKNVLYIFSSNDDFVIPELPCGQRLVIKILSTWGDQYYVGLNGIEIFSDTGKPVQISKVRVPSKLTPHYLISHHITLHHTTPHHITLPHTTLHYITPHYTTLNHITSYHFTAQHITPHHYSTTAYHTALTLHSHCTHTAPLHITPLCITAHHHITPNQITPHHIQYAPLSLLILKNVFTWGCSSITFYINCNVFYSRLLPTLLTSTFFLNTRKIQEYQLTLLMAYTVRGRFKGPFTLRSI